MKQFLLLVVVLYMSSAIRGQELKKEDDHQASKKLKNLQFSWNDCSPKENSAVLKSLQVSPDPIVIPGNISIGFELDSNVNLTSPSPVIITLICFNQ